MHQRLNSPSDVYHAWLLATLFSGVPSTIYLTATGQSLWPPIHAVGTMLVSADAAPWLMFLAAAGVHCAVSLFWIVVFASLSPAKHVTLYALAASALIAMLDLRIIAPLVFPEVARLSFWPQFADHLTWGLLTGMALQWRKKRKYGGNGTGRNAAN